MSEEDDVKDLLRRAFDEEPPLRIDRDEVVQAGRKRLRRRRAFEAGTVVVAVVLAAVGAATLTNLVERAPERMPPAASSTAPPGPQLPVPHESRSTPPSSGSTPLTTTESPPPSVSAGWALELTRLLYRSGALEPTETRPIPGKTGDPQFELYGSTYVFKADVTKPGKAGLVVITVGPASRPKMDCAAMSPEFHECEIRKKDGVDVLLARSRTSVGESRYAAAVLADGTEVTASASNLTAAAANNGKQPSDSPPVLDENTLCEIVTRAGLSAS